MRNNKTISFPFYISQVSLLVGLAVIIGWLFNISGLVSIFPGYQSMKLNTAIGFVFSGLALFFLTGKRYYFVWIFALVPVLIGSLSLYQDFFTIDIGIDELIIKDIISEKEGYPHPGRPAVATSLSFLLLNAAFFAFTFRRAIAVRIAQYSLHVVTFITFIALIGYILNVATFYKFYFVSSMALHTAILFLLLSLSAAFLNPDKGMMLLFTGKKSGNIMIRRLFPQMLAIVIIIGYLRMLAHRNHWVSEEFGIALVTVGFVIAALFVLSYSVKKLNDLDDARSVAADKIYKLNLDLQNTIKDLEDYKYALEESSIVAITDANGIIQHVNDNFCSISGYSRNELIGSNHRLLKSGFHSKEFYREMWATISAGKIWRGEIKNKSKSGEFYWLDTSIVPFLEKNGKPVKYLAIRSDITERINFLEQLKQSEEIYRDLYENTLVSIITYDMKVIRPIQVNEVAVRQFGYKSKEDFIRNFITEDHFVDIAEYRLNLALLQEGNEIADLELRMRKLNGDVFWAKVFVRLTNNKELGQVVIVDVTELVKNKRELAAKVTELEGANKELETFSFISSHDLQEPLRKIINFVGVIQQSEGKRLSPEGEYYLTRLTETSKQMRSLLSDLLLYYRVRNVNQIPEVVDLNNVVQLVLDEFEKTIQEKGVEIKITNLCQLEHAINFQIHELVKNLISNSIKFSDPLKKPFIEIRSDIKTGKELQKDTLEYATSYCHIVFSDNGIGFDPRFNVRIFEIFERLDPEKYTGTGMGLAICHRIVKNHRGFISAHGEPGKGSRFDIYLPRF